MPKQLRINFTLESHNDLQKLLNRNINVIEYSYNLDNTEIQIRYTDYGIDEKLPKLIILKVTDELINDMITYRVPKNFFDLDEEQKCIFVNKLLYTVKRSTN